MKFDKWWKFAIGIVFFYVLQMVIGGYIGAIIGIGYLILIVAWILFGVDKLRHKGKETKTAEKKAE
jgi:uncharacterized membrane protein